MGLADRIPGLNRLDGYEQASLLGSLLIVIGSTMSWLEIDATASAAAEHDDLEAGVNVFTGQALGWGDITLALGVVAILALAVVVWRYRAAGRKTGLLLMLLGLIVGGIGLLGIVLTGMLFSGIDQLAGVSLSIGGGIFVTLIGAVVLFSGGILRLASGPPEAAEPDPAGSDS